MNRAVAWGLLAVVGLTGCAGGAASAPAPVVVPSPPIEVVEGAAGAEAEAPSAEGEVVTEEAPREADDADAEVDPAVTEACVNACRAAGGEMMQQVDDRLVEAERDCKAAAGAKRQPCLAAARDEHVSMQQAAEGSEHACRTSCPGYLNQYR